MASHHQRSADVLPFPVDHAGPRFVRPMRELDMARGDQFNIDLYSTLEEQRRIAAIVAEVERERRIERLQVRIGWACIALASLTILYFIFQAGRGM